MKKRIGTKIYDTEKGICVLPEKNLYKQPKNKTFYFYDGEIITPVDYDTAADMIRGASNPELLSILTRKADVKGDTCIKITVKHADKLAEYSRRVGISQKKIIENFIDSLSIE